MLTMSDCSHLAAAALATLSERHTNGVIVTQIETKTYKREKMGNVKCVELDLVFSVADTANE